MSGGKVAGRRLALLLDLDTSHGVYRLTGEVLYRDPEPDDGYDGWLRPSWERYGPESLRRFADLIVTAYLDRSGGRSYGYRVEFRPHHIEHVTQASEIAATLRKVNAGLARMDREDGYLTDEQFHAFVLRVCKILRVGEVLVRNSERARMASGERYRTVDGSGLQAWVWHITGEIKAGRTPVGAR